MAEFEVAHVREQGQDMIIILVHPSFGYKSPSEQVQVRDSLEGCAHRAGLAGTAVLVWDSGGGRMGFLAPPQWHGFFRSIGLAHIAANINNRLTCG